LTFARYRRLGGGQGLAAARKLGPDGVVEHLTAAGLRGRGGAGFPTGRKWAAVRSYASAVLPATVVVNAAEGEPGSFKDRAILRRNAYAVLEGGLIAAAAVGADRVVVALKGSFQPELVAVDRAIDAVRREGWAEGVEIATFAGPSEYLFGEETGLLEAIDGRPPLPRVAPPYRHGVDEVPDDGDGGAAAQIVLADATHQTSAPPTLVNNVETLANVPEIIAKGPGWFRSLGTTESPGTIVCTVTGCVRRQAIAEVPMGTSLRRVIEEIGGGARRGRRIVAAMSGVANAIVPVELLDTPLSYEGMQGIGSGLGTGGYLVLDDTTDFAAVAAGVSGFLAVESCGQCTPCKQDGLALARLLDRICASDADEAALDAVHDHLRTIADGARCFLAEQHQRVISSIAARFAEQLESHVAGVTPPALPEFLAPIQDLRRGHVTLDETQRHKQPDWTFGLVDSGKAPADRLSAS
jgi:NADH:ubiquinone oxidoreductase subunit F (NADH-binding)